MVNYVGEQKFLKWYKEMSKCPLNNAQILNEIYKSYCDEGKEYYIISADQSTTGNTEEYTYEIKDIGCCGASTIYITF